MTDDATFHNGIVQRADFRLIRSHCIVAELLQMAQPKKNSPFIWNTEAVTDRCQRTRIIQKQPRWYSKALRQQKRKTATGKERFFITNIVKGHKVTTLTRPNELGTMTSNVATRSPERTRLWKRLCAPSYNTAEDTQLRNTIFFKGRTQCIQDRYQQHSETTWTRWGSQASVYPSPSDPGSDAGLHQTVARQCGRNNPKLLHDGTHPTSQDFFHLPPCTTWYNAAVRLVYL
jgi:hypothetical protein